MYVLSRSILEFLVFIICLPYKILSEQDETFRAGRTIVLFFSWRVFGHFEAGTYTKVPQTSYIALYFVVSEFLLLETPSQMQSPTWSQCLAITLFQILHSIKTGSRIVMYVKKTFLVCLLLKFLALVRR